MSRDATGIDIKSPPFDQFRSVEPLGSKRSGRDPAQHVRHHLYVAREKRGPTAWLVKITSRPGLVYQQNLANEIATLTTINRELPDARYFPVVREHGKLRDGRVYLITSMFDELPLATVIGPEPIPARTVLHIRTAIEVARALVELHRLGIFHVDLNPMNILYRVEKDRLVIRIVDFESSYERARHTAGVFYDPPTTAGYSAPEVPARPPDARSDLYSLGAVLYTMLAGYQWTWESDAAARVAVDKDLDPELQRILLEAVDRDPDKRCPNVEVWLKQLGAYLEQIWPGRSW